jgi:hypothetical protein
MSGRYAAVGEKCWMLALETALAPKSYLEAATGIQVVEDSRRRTRFRGRAASADVILRR